MNRTLSFDVSCKMFRFLIKLLLITITVSSFINKIKATKSLRSDEGSDVEAKDFPFIVAVAGLVIKGKLKEVYRVGTGVLLTGTWVLTAAHIFDDIDPEVRDKLCVLYGDFTRSPYDTGMYTEVFDIYSHPGFYAMPFISEDLFFSINDVALMIISKISVATYGRLSSVNHASLLGLTAKYIGFADTKKSGDDVDLNLKLGHGMVRRCGPPEIGWSQNLLCIIPSCQKKSQTISYAGSGGEPLFVDNQIVGIFSMNFSSKASILWPAFTPVDMYLDWINDLIKRYE